MQFSIVLAAAATILLGIAAAQHAPSSQHNTNAPGSSEHSQASSGPLKNPLRASNEQLKQQHLGLVPQQPTPKDGVARPKRGLLLLGALGAGALGAGALVGGAALGAGVLGAGALGAAGAYAGGYAGGYEGAYRGGYARSYGYESYPVQTTYVVYEPVVYEPVVHEHVYEPVVHVHEPAVHVYEPAAHVHEPAVHVHASASASGGYNQGW